MNIPIFSNPFNIIDDNFKKMIDRWEWVKMQTNDRELRDMTKYIIARDYYDLALEWYNRFKDADWYKEDLI